MKTAKNIRKMKLLLVLSVGLISINQNVLAYLDPGTGGVLFNTLWPLILGIFVAIGSFFTRYFWNPIKKTFSKIFGKGG